MHHDSEEYSCSFQQDIEPSVLHLLSTTRKKKEKEKMIEDDDGGDGEWMVCFC